MGYTGGCKMSRFSLAVISIVSCLGAGPVGVAQTSQPQETAHETACFEGEFALGQAVPIDIRLGIAEEANVVQARSIRFEKVGDSLRAAVRLVKKMVAAAKWRVSVELLDTDGQKLGRPDGVFATEKFMRLSRVSVEGDLWLRLEPWEAVSKAARFVVALERAPDTAAITVGLRRTSPVTRGKGNLSLSVQVVDDRGESAQAGYIRLWRAIRADEKQCLGAFRAHGNNPRALGTVWHDPATERTWEPCGDNYGINVDHMDQPETVFENLGSGEYRVTAVRALRDPDPDPTPMGVSEIIRLDERRPRATVTVRLDDGAALRVKLTDAATGEALDGARVLLMRADGFPLGAEYSSDADGVARYAHLAPGEYWLQAKKTVRGHRPADYLTTDRVRVPVGPGQKNQFDLTLQPVFLDEVEVWRRWPWCVTGRVTDNAGNPMPRVEISAHCGHGTLRRTDVAITGPDGRYTLRPMPGIHYWDEQKEEWHAGVQAATIFAHKHGYYEANLCRQGGLLMADDSRDRGATWGPTTAGVLVPKEPYRLDFVMVPAAVVKRRLVDETGRPVPAKYVSLEGDELPPSSSALASVKTDDDGRFTISSVPSKCYWFTLRHAQHEWPTTKPIDFAKPGLYEVELAYDGSTDGAATLTCKSVKAP